MFEHLTDIESEYDITGHTVGAEQIMSRWSEQSAAFRQAFAPNKQHYGDGEREYVDVFSPGRSAPNSGVMIFIHGGYWMRFSPTEFHHLAQGALTKGWHVAMPSYPLAPSADIACIAQSTVRALELVAHYKTDGPLRLVGHSAGGHLASFCASEGVLSAGVAERIDLVLSVSGVHDLRCLPPSRRDAIDPTHQLGDKYSPVLRNPLSQTKYAFWVGSEERPEFHRQSRLMADMWMGLGASTQFQVVRGRNHFDILDLLMDADSAMARLVLA